METYVIAFFMVGVLLVFLFIGMPVAFGAALAGFLGVVVLAGWGPALALMGTVPFAKIVHYEFAVIPLFVIMGYFAFSGGLATKAFEVGKIWLGHVRGGLIMATIFANACFAACCGVSVASAAIFGKLTIPEMERMGVNRSLAAGCVASCGTLACMIPPSGTMVIYALMAQTSIGKQLIAGVFPGILTAVLYTLMVLIKIRIDPSVAGNKLTPTPWKERLSALPQIWGIAALAFIIIGGIYSGIVTSTEAAALGAFAALLISLSEMRKKTPGQTIKSALLETGRTTGMVAAVLFGVIIFANFIALSRITFVVSDWISALAVSRYLIIAVIVVFYLVLGMFFESIGMLLLSVPVLLPIILKLGFDPIWFGVFAIKLIEIGLVTPPVGITVFVVRSVAPQIPLTDIFRGIIPFVATDLVVVVLLIAFPQIALFLPGKMG